MKRGKRQVIQSQNQNNNNHHQQNQLPSNYFENLGNMQNEIVNNKSTYQHQNLNQLRKLQGKSQIINTKQQVIQTVKIDEMDEKKRKIELLKQKYLKKNKGQENKQQIENINRNQNTIITTMVKQDKLPSFLQPQVKETVVQVPKITKNQEFPVPVKVQQKQIKTKSEVLNADQSQIMKNQALQSNQHYQVPKPVARINSRNPPPPPGRKQPPPPTNKAAQIVPTDQINLKQNPTQLSRKSLEDNQPLLKTQKNDNKSFAPPSLALSSQSTQQEKSTLTASSSSKQQPNPIISPPVPPKLSSHVPPPPNIKMKQILSKKLPVNKQILKPSSRLNNNQNQNINSTLDQPTQLGTQYHENLQLISQNDKRQNKNNGLKNKKQIKNIPIDEEYILINHEKASQNPLIYSLSKATPHEDNEVDPTKFIGEWLGSPQLTLKELFPSLRQIIQFYCLNKHIPLQITSTNSTFTFLTQTFFQAFVINNTVKLSQDQKSVTQALCLNFFYSNSNQLSDVFLISLLKMGPEFFQKYESALEDKLYSYLKKLILFKNLLLTQQIDNFVNFCIQKHFVTERNFVLFLMLACQNSQLITVISNTVIQDLKCSLGVLSFCKLNLKAKPHLIGLFLKLIFNLAQQFSSKGLVQRILTTLKQIDIPQNLYQYSKQIKLKLINSFDGSKNQVQERRQKVEGVQQSSETAQNKDNKGIFGYFNNINKAIDKIKVSTQKALGVGSQKPTKSVEEEKKDEIKWDPIKKRYVINGQIPEDQGNRGYQEGQQDKTKSPPPPPPLGSRKKAPPPPPLLGKKPGPRISNNRYV